MQSALQSALPGECLRFWKKFKSSKRQIKVLAKSGSEAPAVRAVALFSLELAGAAQARARLALVAQGTKALFLQAGSGELLHTFSGSATPLVALAVRSDGKLAALANESGEIFVLMTEKRALLRTYRTDSAACDLCFSDDLVQLLSAHADNAVRAWELAVDGAPLLTLRAPAAASAELRGLLPPTAQLPALAYTSDGALFALDAEAAQLRAVGALGAPLSRLSRCGTAVLATHEARIARYSFPGCALEHTYHNHLHTVNAVFATPRHLVSCADDGKLKVYARSSGALLCAISANSPITACAFDEQTSTVLFGERAGRYCLSQLLSAEASNTAFRAAQAADPLGERFFYRGRHAAPAPEHSVAFESLSAQRAERLFYPRAIHAKLQKFYYTEALFTMLKTHPRYFWLLAEHFEQSDLLSKALAGLNDAQFVKLAKRLARAAEHAVALPFLSVFYIFLNRLALANSWLREAADARVLAALAALRTLLGRKLAAARRANAVAQRLEALTRPSFEPASQEMVAA